MAVLAAAVGGSAAAPAKEAHVRLTVERRLVRPHDKVHVAARRGTEAAVELQYEVTRAGELRVENTAPLLDDPNSLAVLSGDSLSFTRSGVPTQRQGPVSALGRVRAGEAVRVRLKIALPPSITPGTYAAQFFSEVIDPAKAQERVTDFPVTLVIVVQR